MYKILVLFLISLCFTTVAIYADCNLPTGGACKIEDLKQKQETSSSLENFDIIKKLDTKTSTVVDEPNSNIQIKDGVKLQENTVEMDSKND